MLSSKEYLGESKVFQRLTFWVVLSLKCLVDIINYSPILYNLSTDESVMWVSNDVGQTFGPVLNLGTNGTLSTTTTATETTTAGVILNGF